MHLVPHHVFRSHQLGATEGFSHMDRKSLESHSQE